MKALVLVAYNRFEIQDCPEPEISPDEVLVKVAACGICGSDVHGMDGSSGRRLPPLIMGHEAAGVIARLGENVTGWSVGDRVTFDSVIPCRQCWFCRHGQVHLCEHRRVPGVNCSEFQCQGALAEYVALPHHVLYRLPDGLSFRHAALVEPLAIAMHAVSRLHRSLDDAAVVVGAGVIGLMAVQVLRAAGCGQIIAADLDRRRLDLACKLGADQGLQSDVTDVRAEVMRQTGNRGADLAVEAVGIAPTAQLAAVCLRRGGQLALVGLLAPRVEFPVQDIVTRELTIAGSYCSCEDYPACLDLMARGTIQVEPLISAVAPLAEGAAWFQRLHCGKEGLMKVLLEP